jgi:hypothetical protein
MRFSLPFPPNAARLARAGLLLGMACGLAGCAGGGAVGTAISQAGGATVAFESIDGPPPQVFDRMVSALDSEAKLRNVAVVSREGAAAYRVRGYLAAQIVRGRTTIAWVWDIYDGNQQRALRLSGQEPTGKSGRDAWALADDVVLRRIAQAGLTGLGGMINGSTPGEPQPAPSPAPIGAGPAIASLENPEQVSQLPESVSGFAAR